MHVSLIFHEIKEITFWMNFLLIMIGIFYLSGEPLLPHLLSYSAFVVKGHNIMRRALPRPSLPLRQPRLANNPGLLIFIVKTCRALKKDILLIPIYSSKRKLITQQKYESNDTKIKSFPILDMFV